ncbi:MAG: hypothetical protein IPM91_04400 [Bacteroidetes bacterium]|nr:hypothetical protein [Bacteroidota bacterium]
MEDHEKIRLLLMILFLITLYNTGYSQCTGGTSGGAITPGLAWQSVNTIGINGGATGHLMQLPVRHFILAFVVLTEEAPRTIPRFRFWIMQVFL